MAFASSGLGRTEGSPSKASDSLIGLASFRDLLRLSGDLSLVAASSVCSICTPWTLFCWLMINLTAIGVLVGLGTSNKGWNSLVAFDLGSSSCHMGSSWASALASKAWTVGKVVATTWSKAVASVAAGTALDSQDALSTVGRIVNLGFKKKQVCFICPHPWTQGYCSFMNWIWLVPAFCPLTETEEKCRHFDQSSASTGFHPACRPLELAGYSGLLTC